MDVIVERCAALDVHKDTVMACVRRPGWRTRRMQDVREFRTWTSSLRELRVVAQLVRAAPVIARLRDLTRYRAKLVQNRAREVQRVQKVLEAAGSSWNRWCRT